METNQPTTESTTQVGNPLTGLLTNKERDKQKKILKTRTIFQNICLLFFWFSVFLLTVSLGMQLLRDKPFIFSDFISDNIFILFLGFIAYPPRSAPTNKYVVFDSTGIAFWHKDEEVFVPYSQMKPMVTEMGALSVILPVKFHSKVRGLKGINIFIYDSGDPNLTLAETRELLVNLNAAHQFYIAKY